MGLNEKSSRKPSCPTHGKKLEYRVGRFGGYLCCEHYPDQCDVTASRSEFDNQFYMTDQETRDARKAAHAAFDRLWRSRAMSRGGAYRWLQNRLHISSSKCHIQHFGPELCAQVVAVVEEWYRDWDGKTELPAGGRAKC